MSNRLSEDSARKLGPDTFRVGLTQNGKAFAMHFTFPDQQGEVMMFAIEALPAIVAQLQSLLPSEGSAPQEAVAPSEDAVENVARLLADQVSEFTGILHPWNKEPEVLRDDWRGLARMILQLRPSPRLSSSPSVARTTREQVREALTKLASGVNNSPHWGLMNAETIETWRDREYPALSGTRAGETTPDTRGKS